ncbi:DUF945 family protein [Acinetobacter brisouii]|uniref:DUF945 family protein n=1 Tax=Acinetobacter brisouii TaxID=396323 RepID=UPI0012504914|nr:DUF945 family protein [Acinetobacter brisouii]
MQKKGMIVALGAILVSGAVGANFYADHRLKTYYTELNKNNGVFQKQDAQLNMGLFSGDAHWSYKIVPNPCQPNNSVVIKGVDHIQRSWNGYHIQSDINAELQGKKSADIYRWVLKNQALLKLDTQLNWLGTVNMKISSPPIDEQRDDFQFVWNGVNGTAKLKKENGQYAMTEADLNMPGFTVRNGNDYFSLQSMQLKTDHGLLTDKLQSGKTEFSIQKMVVLDQGAGKRLNLDIDKFKLNTDLDVQEKETMLKMVMSIDNISADTKKLTNMRVNINYMGIDTPALAEFVRLANQESAVCNANQNSQQQVLENQLLKILAHGFSFESKGNQIEFGNGKMTADLNGKFLPNSYANLDELRVKVPQVFQLDAKASVDKQLLRSMMMASGKMPSGMSEQDYDRAVTQAAQAMHAKVNANSIDFAVKYENGQTTYP